MMNKVIYIENVEVHMLIREIFEKLQAKNKFYILTHKFPDGDTLGSAFALKYALEDMGKHAKVLCSDEIPHKFSYLWHGMQQEKNFVPDCIVSVDVADAVLLGKFLSQYADKVDISIDHHVISKKFAKLTLMDSNAAATCQVLYRFFMKCNVNITPMIATCLYTGLSTDTGCFKYKNTTADVHYIAAELIRFGADIRLVNKNMFETQSVAHVLLEKLVLDTLEFYCNNRCAVICITEDMKRRTNAKNEDVDGFASLPKEIEGVEVGITIREQGEREYKLSLRSSGKCDVAKICEAFSGGGHDAAAGCIMFGALDDVKARIVFDVERALKK